MAHAADAQLKAQNVTDTLNSQVQQVGQVVSADALSSTVQQLMLQYQADSEQITKRVAGEVNDLLAFIETAKADIASMQPATLVARDLPTAADELDAIVEHTEQAASDIMDAADELQSVAADCEGELADRIQSVVTKIFEASTFQDITGQRITKVVKVIKFIEDKLDDLADAIGDMASDDGVVVTRDANVEVVGDDALLNGPQLEGDGNSQDDIDALLASFD
ncbi:MAG: protein phosphatase CheZ [Pseudomonadota bacterium]